MCEYNNTGRARMSFYRKYELERLVQKAEPKTFRAREVAGGRTVFLHLLGGMDAVSRASLQQRVHALVASGNPEVIEVDDSEIAPYVVTVALENFEGLPAWLDRVSRAPAAPPPVPASSDSAAPTQSTSRPAARPRPTSPPVPPPAASDPSPPPGEFTVRFASPDAFQPKPETPASPMPPSAPRRTAPPAAPSSPAAAMPSAQAPASGPGEFTLMFAGSKGPSAPAPPPQAPPPAAPPPPPPIAAAPPSAPPPPVPRPRSQFTALYGPGPLSQPPAPAMPPSARKRT